MHPALWQLLWFDLRGFLRGLANLRRSARQIFLLLMMLVFAGFFVFSQVQNSSGAMASRFGSAMPFWAFLYLLGTWVTASADRGLIMRPAEIHFIAGGPFRDRDVLTLNLVRLAFRALVGASVLSLIALAYVDSYPSALIGIWLLIAVSLLVGMLASLSARSAQAGLVRGLRWVFTIAVVGTLLALIAQSMQALQAVGESVRVSAIAATARETPVGRIVLPPLAWMFAPLASARLAPDTLQLLPSRLAVVAGLVAGVYLLGGRYLEASTRRTDLSIRKRQSAARSGAAGLPSSSWTKRLSLPTFGRLGGIGSVAWMQMVHSMRILPRFMLFTIVIVGVVLVIPLTVDPQRLNGWGTVGWMAGLTTYADFLLLLQLPVGFLGPVAQREMLKSLPLPSWRIVFGQLAGPVIPLALLHVVVTILFLYLVPGDWWLVLQTSLALIPAAWVLIANVNLLGAWNVIQPRALQQRDAMAAGRAMASVWIFSMMLIPAVVMSVVGSILAAILFGSSVTSYLAGAALGGLLSSSIYVALLTASFHRWQPASADGGQEEAEHDR